MKFLLFYIVFLILVCPLSAQIIPSSFKPPVIYDIPDQSSNDNSNRLEVGDLDGDGKIDIMSADISRGEIHLFRNIHSGGTLTSTSFATRVDIEFWPSTFHVRGTALTDIDGDGKLDILLANATTPCNNKEFAVLRNTSTIGNFSFAAPVLFEVGGCQSDITVADVDGDGKIDVVTVMPYELNVFRNTSSPGTISFADPFKSPTVNDIRGRLHTADIDTDGKQDILIGYSSDAGNDTLSVYRNTSSVGNISLATQTKIFIKAGVRPWHIKTNDFDRDGKLDVVVSNQTDGVAILKNNSTPGTINLSIKAGFTDIGEQGRSQADIQLADIDGDGLVEIIGSSQNRAHVAMVPTISTIIDSAMFAYPVSFGTQLPSAISGYIDTKIADLNGDGKPDIVSMRRSTIAIYENQIQKAPTITSLSSYAASAGEAITIAGTNFDATSHRNNMVLFGQVRGQTISSTASSIVVEVPLGASLSQVSVIRNGLTALSSRKFHPTFQGSAIDENSFAGSVSFALNKFFKNNLSIADLDSDGKPDIVVNIGDIASFRNTSTPGVINAATLTALPDITAGVNSANSIGLFDLTGDGKPDIIRNDSSFPVIYQNLSKGTAPNFIEFDDRVFSGVGAVLGIPAGDLNLDGKIDLLYVGGSPGAVSIVENFQRADTLGKMNIPDFSLSPNPFTLSTGIDLTLGGVFATDLDGDGKNDVGVVSESQNIIKIFKNDIPAGARSEWVEKFTAFDLPADGNTVAIETIDLDGDGDLEIVSAAGGTSDRLSIYPNQSSVGNITFGAKFTLTTDNDPTQVKAADLDGDGKPELILIYFSLQKISVFKNISTGSLSAASFGPRIDYTLTANARNMEIGDIDLDGKPDIVVGLNSAAIVILKNMIVPGATITIDRQPTNQSTCVGGSLEFQIGASSTATLAFQWQVDNGTGFSNLANNTQYSGVTSATLTINNVAASQTGFQYRCIVSANSQSVTSSTATLTVSNNVAPGVVDASSCQSASVTLTATGGSNGNYRWYRSSTDVNAIPGETNNTYITPILNVTTSFYVSIVNGQCESNRTEVKAVIGNLPAPEITINGSVDFCEGESVTLIGPTGFTQYNWSNGAISQQVEITANATLTLRVGDGTCLSQTSEPVTVTVHVAPAIPDIIIINDFLMVPFIQGLSYQWFDEDAPIDGANSNYLAINFLAFGDYTVEASVGSCSAVSLPLTYIYQKIEKDPGGGGRIAAYPNPFNEELHLEGLSSSQTLIEILDLSGRTIFTHSTSSVEERFDLLINTQELAPGYYILMMHERSNETPIARRILKR